MTVTRPCFGILPLLHQTSPLIRGVRQEKNKKFKKKHYEHV